MENMQVGDWVLRTRVPVGEGPFPVILMLHGWTGDENSMQVFVSRLPKAALLIMPRGLFAASAGGYSWYPETARLWPGLDAFRPAIDRLPDLLSSAVFPQGDFSHLHLLGFSQGAALSYAFVVFQPEQVASVAGLAGFMPEGAEAWAGSGRLAGLPAFIAHGTQDSIVPVGRARQAAAVLRQAGAAVTYCEDEVGHKLSANCFRSLQVFYSKI